MRELDEVLLPSRHVPRLALDWIQDRPEELWRSVEGAMVFADVAGFTALSERLATKGRIGAEELVETLSRVFGCMIEVAAERGGQLVKFGGDALLFLFDDADTGGDAARQAACAAVEMRAELRRAAAVPTSVGRLNISVSTGVHAGRFDYFLVGGSHRELVVLGPGVSSVVRAENAATAGEILLTPAAAAALPGKATVEGSDGHRRLLWRKAPAPPVGRRVPRSGDAHAARRLLPGLLFGSLDGTRPDPGHRAATIGFMRFSGTDRTLADQGPHRLAEALHRTLSIAQAAYAEEDVALLCVDCDKDGGKLFVSSGVPLTNEDDEGRMLRAARAIVAAGPPLPLQIGINRGHVFVAEVGIPFRAAFSAMGDTTNTAARICAKAGPGEILVHPQVLEHARTRYDAEPVGPFTFKGKALPQLLYRLGEEIGARNPLDREDLPLIGRAEELRALVDTLRLTDGHGASAVVVGPVGVGKSRLLEEVLSGLPPDLPRLALHAEPYGSSSYRVFRDPLRAVLGVSRGDEAEMAAALRHALETSAPRLLDVAALIGDVAYVAVEPSETVRAILPEHRADRAADAVVDLLAEVYAEGLVVVMEDGHWADPASARLVERLAQEAAVRPWLVMVSQREAEPDEGVHVTDPSVLVELPPLGGEAVRELAIVLTGAAPLRPDELALVVARADGNPLFAREMIRAGQELGSLEAVPASLQGAVAAQVDVLDPLSRRALSYASVLGRTFRDAVFAELLDSEGVELAAQARERLDRFLAVEEGRWRFRHGVLRDVVYDGLGYHLRARLHGAAGDAVERLSVDRAADADGLALHFSRAGRHEKAFEYALMAAERSEAQHAGTAAAAQLAMAIEAARRIGLPRERTLDLWLRLSAASELAGHLGDSLVALRQAGRLAEHPDAQAEVWLKRAETRHRTGAFSAALRDCARVARLVERDGASPRHRARQEALVAKIRMRQERASEALAWALRAARSGERTGDDWAVAQAEGVLSWAEYVTGHADRAKEAGLRAMRLFARLGDVHGTAMTANNLGGLSYYEGDWTAALDLYRESRQAYSSAGHVVGAELGATNIGEVLVNQGRYDDARGLLEDAARIMRASGVLWGASWADMHLGRLCTGVGELGRAEQLLRRCIEDSRAMGSPDSALESAIHLATCLSASGRYDEALGVLVDADPGEPSLFDAAAALARGSALRGLGRLEEARSVVAAGIHAAEERALGFDLARLLLLQADLGVDPERVPEARRLLDGLGVVTAG